MSAMTRRNFLAAAAAQTGKRRPNVLLCVTDDQSWPHTSVAGCRWVRTPALERVAQRGVVFENAFVATPSCAPSRASLLSGQEFYRLGPASMNHAEWRRGLEGYPDLLARQGYRVGCTGKGWGPGNWRSAGRAIPPAGPDFNQVRLKPPAAGLSDIDYASNFARFRATNAGAPFCFWAGFSEPHRVFASGSGVRGGRRLEDVQVPPFLPDTPEVRSDLLDYAAEIEWADAQLGKMLDQLERTGELANTLVIFTSDNGMAFPRAKGNVYEYGVHVPLVLAWPEGMKGGRVSRDLVSLTDVAPTILEAVGMGRPAFMTGRSLLGREPRREEVVFGIERHFPGSRPEGAGYPMRALRTDRYLYIENLTPRRNPAGDRPGPVWPADDETGGFGDTDGSPTKTLLCRDTRYTALFDKAFGKRPAAELYDVKPDPANLRNLAAEASMLGVVQDLKARLDRHRRATQDPRILGRGGELDEVMRRFPTTP